MSAKFTEYKGLNLPKVAEEVLAFWKENNVFEKSVSTREGATPYVFLKGHLQQMDYQGFITYLRGL